MAMAGTVVAINAGAIVRRRHFAGSVDVKYAAKAPKTPDTTSATPATSSEFRAYRLNPTPPAGPFHACWKFSGTHAPDSPSGSS